MSSSAGTAPGAGRRPFDFDTLEVGTPLGPIDYVLTEGKRSAFRRAVADPQAPFPTIAAKDYAYLLWSRYEPVLSMSAKQESWYRNAPVVGRRITARGRVEDKYERRGRRYVVVEAESVDETGLEIARSRTTLLIGGIGGSGGSA